MNSLRVVEICAGAGGQSIGLHRAGFDHALAVELDAYASQTLRDNTDWKVAEGDVADLDVWNPLDYEGVDLLAGGVPCPPFSIAGKQLGSSDERDLFAWAVEQVGVMHPRALLLENVRGLAAPRFAAYRQHILDRLAEFGYVADWRLLHSADYGVAQLRPRFVLVAMLPEDAAYFRWPEPVAERVSVGEALRDLMGANGWPHVDDWAAMANRIGPTLVGGSKKHGGADLGPTRAKSAWAAMGVDGRGVANSAPAADAPHPSVQAPKLTIEMVARLQGWRDDFEWKFAGRKTAQYRQIGNAFPPPVAEAIGNSIRDALTHEGSPHELPELTADVHDPVYRALSSTQDFVSMERLIEALTDFSQASVERRLAVLARDFDVEIKETSTGVAYKLGEFKGFTGQANHTRHAYFETHRNRVS
ncbi:DNA cytosine methyltransferase [Clavibacter californiensis]|uniref:Cytosine-specific methyltransferase n=1 Tax=Clavibacter californiensis TaxID=1401995 RepID=A0ABX9N7Z6_9MICO|nr:DNA (cytosine-5-)-methyltransferase [Clavibacter californiensis]RII93292.1 DNA (cytosine-5-)-methyltransferase [Clavibacter californiensis]UKF78914.1 DNA cytosine methyltransferase [Clavibacter californiensis]